MKKFLAILISISLAVLHANAQTTAKYVDIHLDNKPLSDLVKHIEAQTSYRFYYDDTVFDSLKVSVDFTSASVAEVLDKAFNSTAYHYSIYESSIFLTKEKQIITRLPTQFQLQKSKEKLLPADAPLADLAPVKNSLPASLENKVYTIGNKSATDKPNATLAGYVRSSKTGEPVSGLAIFTGKPKVGVVTDLYGFYSLSLPKGRHELSIRGIGFRDTRRQILLEGDGKLDINVNEQMLSLKEVVITADKASNIRRTQMGIEKLDIKTIKQVPTVFGEADVLRVVLTLPGVKSVGESSTGFNVRGGAVDQNLILFNEATVYNPSHFFGFFSAFNPEVIKDVQLYKSSIPAKYGGRLSSVLELNSREGNKKEFTGTAGLGLITSRLNIEGPLIKDKTSFIFGGRTTYSNWIMNFLPARSGYRDARASFYDLNLNISHQQNAKNSFYFTGYLSSDKSNLSTDTTFRYLNENLALRWKHSFHNKLYSILSTGIDRYQYNNYSNHNEDIDYRLKFSIQQTNLKLNFNYYPNPKQNLEFGFSSIYYVSKPGSLQPYSEKSLLIADALPKEQALESAVFVEDRYDVTKWLTLNAGLRYSMFNSLGPANVNTYPDGYAKNDANLAEVKSYGKGDISKTYQGPEYRLGARFAITSDFSFKAGYNSLRQYIHMLSNTTSVSPTDVWKLSDRNISPQTGNQFSLGLYKNFKHNTIETSVEAYQKKMNDYLDYKSGAVLILNHKIEQDVLPTQGKAYGVEFMVKKLAGKLNGWVSYTYSRTKLKTEDKTGANSINEGNYYPSNYDKPHDFTLIGNYRLSHRVSVSVNTTYSTGRPITLPVGKYYYAGGQRVFYSNRNEYRIPDYFRSDFSLNVLGNHKLKQFSHNSWTFGVYNLTGRKNAFSTYFASQDGRINGYKLSIFGTAIPFVNYNVRFK